MTGTIFDIQRFALHDGPGIRTVVFLKGCPLSCHWCFNPESISPKPQLAYDKNKCTQCLKCVEVCTTRVFTFVNNELRLDRDKCNLCGKCIEVCSSPALKIFGYTSRVDEIIDQVVKDKLYYEKSGGGMTLSGGEALMQPDFAVELMKAAKNHGIHTCLETTGFGSRVAYERMTPYVDIFLFDYKHSDTMLHKQYTGRTPEKMLSALEFLCKNGASLILRCPVIPGVNDSLKHFKAIVQLGEKYPEIEAVELMPYVSWGEHKYNLIGKEAPGFDPSPASEWQVDQWIEQLHDLGCTKARKS